MAKKKEFCFDKKCLFLFFILGIGAYVIFKDDDEQNCNCDS